MIKNRTFQIGFLSMACTVGVIAILASVGLFDGAFRWDFYIHFTNLSNYLCIGILFAELVATIKKKEDSYITTKPLLKFKSTVSPVNKSLLVSPSNVFNNLAYSSKL